RLPALVVRVEDEPRIVNALEKNHAHRRAPVSSGGGQGDGVGRIGVIRARLLVPTGELPEWIGIEVAAAKLTVHDYLAGGRQLARCRPRNLPRSAADSTTFRRRTEAGVASTASSSRMNSRACSSESSRLGIRRTSSSEVEDRMFVSF